MGRSRGRAAEGGASGRAGWGHRRGLRCGPSRAGPPATAQLPAYGTVRFAPRGPLFLSPCILPPDEFLAPLPAGPAPPLPGPKFVEWINDSSANVLFADAPTAKRAVAGLGKPLPPDEAPEQTGRRALGPGV